MLPLLVLVRFEDIVLLEDNGVPTEDFLNCCKAMLPFFGEFVSPTSPSRYPPLHFNTPLLTITCRPLLILYISPLHVHTSDTMNSTAFSPVKSDINGNIEVHCRQSSHSEHRRHLLSLLPLPPPPSSPYTCTHTEINEEVY